MVNPILHRRLHIQGYITKFSFDTARILFRFLQVLFDFSVDFMILCSNGDFIERTEQNDSCRWNKSAIRFQIYVHIYLNANETRITRLLKAEANDYFLGCNLLPWKYLIYSYSFRYGLK